MKLNLKEIDFKQFLLEKGERVGVGVAVALMLILILWGLFLPSHGFFSGSPTEKAGSLDKMAESVEVGLRSNSPGDADKPDKDAEKRRIDLDQSPTKAGDYHLAGLFHGVKADKTTRRQPDVLPAAEGAVATTWANIDSYVPVLDPQSGVIVGIEYLKELGKAGGGGMPGIPNLAGPGGAMGGMPGRPGMPPGMPGGGMMGGGPGRPGMQNNFQALGLGGLGRVQGLEERKVYTPVSVKLRDIGKTTEGSPARQLRPLRMAIIAASFPYRAQIEEFQNKLKLGSPQEVLNEQVKEVVKDPATGEWKPTGKTASAFRFLGVNVQRRILDSAGNPLVGWTDIDLGAAYRPWLMVTGKRFEPDKPEYASISFPGLTMRPPLQFRENPSAAGTEQIDKFENKYPDVETRLTKINETLNSLKTKDPAEIFKPPAAFDPTGFDPFNATQQAEPAGRGAEMGPGKPMPPGGPGNPGGATAPAAQTIPEYCLIRLIDLTIAPGQTYQYRIQVRMANPNYGRDDVADPSWAKEPELVSKEWFPIPETATVPAELMYYALDEADVQAAEGKKYTGPNPGQVPEKDRNTVLQVHRWLGAAQIRSMRSREPYMIGEWAVVDRIRVYRGEYADRPARVEIPVWSYIHNDFLLPVDPDGRKNRTRGFEVDFSNEGGEQTILVDFDGGPKSYNRATPMGDDDTKPKNRVDDSSTTEVLLMNPEGKLLGHDAATDSQDPRRKTQREVAIQRVEHVLTKGQKTAPATGGNPFGNTPKP